MNSLQTYSYDGLQLRTVITDGGIYFSAEDMCVILGATADVLNGLDSDEKRTIKVQTLDGAEDMLAVNESGLYTIIVKSGNKAFRHWISRDVIPLLRKREKALTQEELIASPDFIIRLAQELKAERIKVQTLKEQSEKDRSKLVFVNALETAGDTYPVSHLMFLLRKNGLDITRKEFYKRLRDGGYLSDSTDETWNAPTRKSLDEGLFTVSKQYAISSDGSVDTIYTKELTVKGLVFFTNLFLSGDADETR